MDRIMSSRIVRTLSLVAAVTLPGCIVEGGHGHNNLVDNTPYYPGCPALQGVGSSGLIGLSSYRGHEVSLESYTFAGEYIRHYKGRGILGPVRSSFDGDDATFQIVSGLADSRCISFQSVNYPGYYLNQSNGEVFLDPSSSDLAFAEDATFCPRPGLADPYALSFEACGFPGLYLNHLEGYLYVGDEPGYEFEEDATFLIDAPF